LPLYLNLVSQAVFTVLPLRFAIALRALLLLPLPRSSPIRGDQMFDLACAAIWSATFVLLRAVRPGSIYFWMKDLTQEFLKLSVLQTALELGDKASAGMFLLSFPCFRVFVFVSSDVCDYLRGWF
jgi:hypothetical protein